jgi:hypothetical protein
MEVNGQLHVAAGLFPGKNPIYLLEVLMNTRAGLVVVTEKEICSPSVIELLYMYMIIFKMCG